MNWENIKTKNEKGGLYTGVSNFKIDAVNPTKEELSEILGMTLENELTYENRIDIRLSNDDVNTKTSFWLKDEEVKTDKDGGKFMYINGLGQTTWGPDVDSLPDWYDRKDVRIARKGEADIYSFMIGWLNPDLRDGELVLPFEELCNGDVSSLKGAIEHFSDREVKGVLGVKNGKYMEVSPRNFGHANLDNMKRFERLVENWRNVHSTVEYGKYEAPKEPSMLDSGESDDLPF
jgi:hypothetical protein